MCNFYQIYLDAKIKYKNYNDKQELINCFLVFSGSVNIEFIQVCNDAENHSQLNFLGLNHIGFLLESINEVDRLCLRLEQNKYTKLEGPQYKNNGFYAARFLDPESNMIEITAA